MTATLSSQPGLIRATITPRCTMTVAPVGEPSEPLSPDRVGSHVRSSVGSLSLARVRLDTHDIAPECEFTLLCAAVQGPCLDRRTGCAGVPRKSLHHPEASIPRVTLLHELMGNFRQQLAEMVHELTFERPCH